jgi:diacylglycerol kinase (ATP)
MRRLGYILGSDDVYELTNQPQDIGRVAEEFKKNEIDVLALNGGDGTNHVTLTSFIEVYGDTPLPKIAFLRGGTMNTISNSVGVHGSPGKILLNLVERYYTGQDFDLTERNLLKVIDDGEIRYGFIFGCGVVANFLEVYYEGPNPRPASAAALVARVIASAAVGGPTIKRVFQPLNVALNLDGKEVPMKSYPALGASTIEQIGLGFRPFRLCEERPDAYHLFTNSGEPTKVAWDLWRLRVGLPGHTFDDHVVHRAELTCDESFPYTIDGDMHVSEVAPLVIEAGPRISIIQG